MEDKQRRLVREFLKKVRVDAHGSTFMGVPLTALTSEELIKIVHLQQEQRLAPPQDPEAFLRTVA